MWKRVQEWWRAEGDLAQLSGLDDRLLADMALERGGLRARVRGGSADQRITTAGRMEQSQPVCTCG